MIMGKTRDDIHAKQDGHILINIVVPHKLKVFPEADSN
jgi:hypothetical protein